MRSESMMRGGRGRHFRRNVFLLLVLAGACEFDDCTGPEDLFDVEGVVVINGQPAAGITVNAGGETAMTAADGTFRMTFVKGTTVPTVSVVPPAGVHFRTDNVLVAASDAVSVRFEGFREASISGRVLAFGLPVPGVTLEIDGVAFTRTTTSAADGTYRIDDVPPSLVAAHFLDVVAGPAGFRIGTGGVGVFVSILGFDVVQDLHGEFRTGANISGTVTSGGAGLAGVIVTAVGAYTTADTTSAAGNYFLARLPPGVYSVSIAGFDPSAHRFATTSQSVMLAADTVVNFAAMPIVPNQAPTAAIQQPANGATFTQGAAVALQGSGTDPEDGALTGAALVWTSSLDGSLGTGASLTVTSLSPGTHTITLTATDAQGMAASASVAVTIDPAPQVPGSISGSVTANGAPIGGVAVTLSGTANTATSTDGNGIYSFMNLTPGSYTVTITNPFPGVTFPALSQTVTLASGQSLVVNFAGTYGSQPPR
jgi:hypothetical protein